MSFSGKRIRAITALGQSLWVDDLNREMLESGELASLLEAGVTGVTSNPSIFERGMGHSDAYGDSFAAAAEASADAQELFERLAYDDVRAAADLLAPIHRESGGEDGFVSFELPAALAEDAGASIEAAQLHRARIDRPNLMIKVPGTEAGVTAFRELTTLGVNVNVTLLFSVARYEQVAEAYVGALETRLERGEPVSGAASVASFFVSRVDTKIDPQLSELGREDLAGRAAIANAKLAYRSFRRIFSGPRWDRLEAAGASAQRPLWGSTSTKNPSYPSTYYVDALIGPRTVNTMPVQTLAAVAAEGDAGLTLENEVEAEERLLRELREAGIEFDRIVGEELVDEGLRIFADAYRDLLETLAEKAAESGNPVAPGPT